MSKCQGIMGAIFGHKFSPRFSEGNSGPVNVKGIDPDSLIKLIRSTKRTTYHHDVCERCGVTVEKHNKQEA